MVNPLGYCKHIPVVYKDHPMFNFGDYDYEISHKDKVYLRKL